MIVSFVIVAYNEERSLPQLLHDLENQDYPHNKIEVLLIDSMSKDSTKSIMERFSETHNDFFRVVVLENPGKQIPCGCNVALKEYTGDAFVRVDAHASIPPEFVRKNVEVLESGEDISGGRVISIPEKQTEFQKMLLLAENSPICGGVAPFRRSEKREYVSTMAFGMYRKEIFEHVGFYNENLPRSEDNDMSYRVRKAGYKLCLDPSVYSSRYTRSTFVKLVKQKYLNGFWIGRTMGINPHCFSVYHFVPFVFVLGILLTSILAVCGHPTLAVLMWSAYVLLILACTVTELIKSDFSIAELLLPFVFLLLHVSYGVGTLVGLIDMPFWVKKIQMNEKENCI